MDWDAIGAIGELVGSLVVAVTLVYLAAQQRQTKLGLQKSIHEARLHAGREWLLQVATDQECRALYDRVYARLGRPVSEFENELKLRTDLNDAEAWTIYLLEMARFQTMVGAMANAAQLPRRERAAVLHNARRLWRDEELGRLWFDSEKANLNPAVVSFVEEAQKG